MPVEFEPYLVAKYVFKESGLRMTKSDKAQQSSRVKIKALDTAIFISIDNLYLAWNLLNIFLEIIRSICQRIK